MDLVDNLLEDRCCNIGLNADFHGANCITIVIQTKYWFVKIRVLILGKSAGKRHRLTKSHSLHTLFRRSACGTASRYYVTKLAHHTYSGAGLNQIGEVQARSWIVADSAGFGSTPVRTASHVDHRQTGFSSTRT